MSRTDGDSHSVCSSRPSVSNPMVKKRSFHRFSIRQLFYASPLMVAGHPRRLNKKKSSSETDARSESSLSTHTAAERDCFGGTSGALGGASAVGGLTSASRLTSACAATASSSLAAPASSQSSDAGDSFSSQTLLKPPSADPESQLLECPLCLAEMPPECFPKLSTCPHRSCQDCLKQYLKIEINESRVNISCPECTEPIHPTDICAILNDVITMNKYEEYTLRRILAKDPDTRWCPAPDCGFAVIAAGCASCPRLQCERPGCQTYFCYHCKQEWHPNQTCDAARAQRSPNIRASSVSFGQDSAQRDDIKPCPRCQVLIVKMDDGSCNHMTCAVCGAEFCWLCMKEISDLHYLSPSGCTFWGKKPWSRKKKILWQLGTLVGAPVGIGLVAGIAVPAIIIGVPVWVGRKLHTRYENASKHKRNLAITGGVTASIIISPILASLAVGIGVPILLAYVYGVVPISLCRSGGCGVSTTSSGVRIDFNDENDMASANGGQTQDGQSVDTRVGNPSIGEVSFGMSASLSMGSGSHLDRMGVIRDSDRESASNTAIAGTSLTGSMSSGMVTGLANHKLEVMADVASNKRFSFSSETASATASLSERSTTMSVADDASTRALAGSITGSRDPSSGFTPVEVHVDATASSHGGSQDSVAHKGHDSVSDYGHDETMSFSRVGSRGRHRLASNDRQMASNFDTESCSLWSRDDTNSERVRFDENVSFIDDMSSDDYQFNAWSGAADAASAEGVPSGRRSVSERSMGSGSAAVTEDTSCRVRVGICRPAPSVWQPVSSGNDAVNTTVTTTTTTTTTTATEPLEEYSDCVGSLADGGEYADSFLLPSVHLSTTTSSALTQQQRLPQQQQAKFASDSVIIAVDDAVVDPDDDVVTAATSSDANDLVEVVTDCEDSAVREPVFYDAVDQS